MPLVLLLSYTFVKRIHNYTRLLTYFYHRDKPSFNTQLFMEGIIPKITFPTGQKSRVRRVCMSSSDGRVNSILGR